MDYSFCHLIFVVETDRIAGTDCNYINKFLQLYYEKFWSSKIKSHFVYLSGIRNFNKEETKKQISDQICEIPNHKNVYYKVICCFDRDRINKDKIRNEEYENFAKEEGYQIVIFANNIENCFIFKGLGSKVENAKYFYNHASKKLVPSSVHEYSLEKCKTIKKGSNLNTVLSKIISKIIF